MYILVVDDNQFANTLVQFVLTRQGYEVEVADNPRRAMQLIEKREPDLLILDVAMPYLSGFEFSAKLREEGYDIPLIFITAQDNIEAKLQGFEIGADDYLCKPYNHQELVARIRAVMRRASKQKQHQVGQKEKVIRNGQLELFPEELKVVMNGQATITLTPKEMHVLQILFEKAGQVVPRELLLAEVWKNNEETSSNVVDVYIRKLRLKLEADPDKPRSILSVRGAGYKFVSS